MQPQIQLNYGAIVAAVVASFVFGWLWYGPLFGKKWAKLMKFPANFKPSAKDMTRSMLLNIFGTFLTAYVLAHSIEVWRPSVWGVGPDGANWIYGFCGATFVWAGYKIPMLLNGVAWGGKSWKLFTLEAAHTFLDLQLIGAILAGTH